MLLGRGRGVTEYVFVWVFLVGLGAGGFQHLYLAHLVYFFFT